MDLNVRAFRTVEAAINGPSTPPDAKKLASRKGGLNGGRSRAKSLGRERRVEIAQKGQRSPLEKNRRIKWTQR